MRRDMVFDRCLIFVFTALALIAGSSSLAMADSGRGSAGANKINRCAVYGPDFVQIDGAEACARVGGHIRVEAGAGNGLRSGFNRSGSDGTRPAALNSEQNAADPIFEVQGDSRGHLRVRELPGSRDLFAR